MKNKIMFSTDPTYYTALYRQKGSRRFYRCGYRALDLNELRDMVYADIREGRYAAAKIIRWDDGKIIEKVV